MRAHQTTALLALTLAGGCTRAPAPAGRVLVDPVGRTVRLPQQIRRIVSLAPSTTELLCAVGGCGLLVGLDRFSNYPPAVAKIARVGNNTDPSVEMILSLKPDVVLMAPTANTRATADSLERLGVATYTCRDEHLDDLYADLRGVAEVIGRPADGEAAAERLRQALATARGQARGTSALVVVWPEPLVVAGRASLVAELLRWLGARNVADDSAQAFPHYSMERVIQHAPEVIIVGTHADGAPPLERLRALPIPASRRGRVHLVDGDLLFRPGPRLGEAALLLARLLSTPPDGGP